MKKFSDVIIIRHADKNFVGKTGQVFFQDLKDGKCLVNLDVPTWVLNQDGIPELSDFCSVNVNDIKPSKRWKEYIPGFMEDFL